MAQPAVLVLPEGDRALVLRYVRCMDDLTWNDVAGGFVVGIVLMLLLGGSSKGSASGGPSLLLLAIVGVVASSWSRIRGSRWDD